MHADLYDYDGTICPGDTGSAFWLFCLLRRPYIVVFAPIQLVGAVCYLLRLDGAFARHMSVYCFLCAVDRERLTRRFAEKRVRKTFPYFLERDRSRPVVVCSASPEFLLRPICDALGAEYLIGTQIDPKTGVRRGKTCKKTEKVRRLSEAFPDAVFDNVYSDSLKHDQFILRLGKTANLVVNGKPHQIRL